MKGWEETRMDLIIVKRTLATINCPCQTAKVSPARKGDNKHRQTKEDKGKRESQEDLIGEGDRERREPGGEEMLGTYITSHYNFFFHSISLFFTFLHVIGP